MAPAPQATIRRARADDHAACCELLAQVDAMHRDALPWLFREAAQPARPAQEFVALLADAEAAVWVAVDALDAPVGIAIGQMRATPAHPLVQPARFGLLDVLVVAAGQRGGGFGRALAQAFEAWAWRNGAAWLEVKVYDFNAAARAAYEALGYRPLSLQLRKPPA